jgi:tRNA nucleotidyltransferase/poly(A) polymerase
MHLEWKNHQNLRDKEANIEAEVTLLEKRSGKLLARGQIYRSQNVKDACQPVIAQKSTPSFFEYEQYCKNGIDPHQTHTTRYH